TSWLASGRPAPARSHRAGLARVGREVAPQALEGLRRELRGVAPFGVEFLGRILGDDVLRPEALADGALQARCNGREHLVLLGELRARERRPGGGDDPGVVIGDAEKGL